MDGLPFTSSSDLPSEIPELSNPIPYTVVNNQPLHGNWIAPYVPCPPEIAQLAIQFSNFNSQDTLVDLGCGDGRILVQAVSLIPDCRKVIGVELDPYLAEFARKSCREQFGQDDVINTEKAVIMEMDMFAVDLIALKASVLVLYLLPKGLEKLKDMFTKWFRDTSIILNKRVVTVNYAIPGWSAIREKTVVKANGTTTMTLYYYDVNSISII